MPNLTTEQLCDSTENKSQKEGEHQSQPRERQSREPEYYELPSNPSVHDIKQIIKQKGKTCGTYSMLIALKYLFPEGDHSAEQIAQYYESEFGYKFIRRTTGPICNWRYLQCFNHLGQGKLKATRFICKSTKYQPEIDLRNYSNDEAWEKFVEADRDPNTVMIYHMVRHYAPVSLVDEKRKLIVSSKKGQSNNHVISWDEVCRVLRKPGRLMIKVTRVIAEETKTT